MKFLVLRISKFFCFPHHRHSYCKTGDDGDIGDRGYQGYTGPEGPKGERGYSGSNGRNGMKGALGDKGSQGLKGEKGESVHTNFTSEFWKLFNSDLAFQKHFKDMVTGNFLKSIDLQGHKGEPGVCVDLRMGNL
uniref:Uncharacterized protein n=1 Tax=Megaselia scalaris TaxID=36166 RepID=T1GWP1_MEGSC